MKNEILRKITQLIKSKNPTADSFLVTLMALNKLSQIASNMRVKIQYVDGGIIPVNFYGLALAGSGFGKGKINNILEDNIINEFQDRFMNSLAPSVSMSKLETLAETKSLDEGIDITVAQAEIYKEWNKLPKHLYTFSDATIEGLKAKRLKLSMIELGSTNMEIDEIALNLERVSDVLSVLLEAFDAGKAKQKLIKVDSNSDVSKVPANLFMFGTPSRLLNGSKLERIFIDFLVNGYARRMFFGYIDDDSAPVTMSAEERLASLRDVTVTADLDNMSSYLASFASEHQVGKILFIHDDVAIKLLEYEDYCLSRSMDMKKYQEIQKAEMKHRYWKAIKLAGILSFISKEDGITMNDLNDAIAIAEESGKAFASIINRPPSHVRLLEFLIDQDKKVTHAELVEKLDFYNSANKTMKEEMITLATAYAYSNNAVIKRLMVEGIEFISAKELEPSDGSKCILSVSTDIVEGYEPKIGEFNNLKLVLSAQVEYCSHHFKDGYRDDKHALPKFNLVILDIDDGTSLQMAMAMMSDYKYVIGTTKRHQTEGYGDRFRMILMLDRTIELDTEEHSKFMSNLYEWLPFKVDTAAKDIARKWSGNPKAMIFENEGKAITSIDFIPDTSKEQAMRERIVDLSNLDSLERWFALNASTGDRNHKTLRYALMLLDGGLDIETIEDKVLAMNSRLAEPLPEREIYQTVMNKVLAMNSRLAEPLPEREIYQTVMKTVRKKFEEIE